MQAIQLDIPAPRYIDSAEELGRVVAQAREAGKVALDTEGTGTDIVRDIPLFGSMATDKWRVAFPAQLFGVLTPMLSDPKMTVIAQYCLSGDSIVWKADGTRKRLRTMVQDRDPGPVLSLNEVTGRLEPRRVVGWVNNPPRPWAEWRRVRVRGKGCLHLTQDHEVLTTRGRVRADQLRVGDRIYTHLPSLPAPALSMIYGSLLGDMSITRQRGAHARSPHLSVTHCEAQHDYLELKAKVLAPLGGKTYDFINRGTFARPEGNPATKLDTRSDARLLDIETICKRHREKTLTSEWLRRLDLPAIAIWVCDDGSTNGKSMGACVTALGKRGAQRLAAHFRRRGWPARIQPRKEDGQLYLYISAGYRNRRAAPPGLDLFWSQISPYIPTCMARKAPKEYRHLCSDAYWTSPSSEGPTAWPDVVTEVGPLCRVPRARGRYKGMNPHRYRKGLRQYCLTVEGNSNFFASGLAVSNCKFDLHMLYHGGAGMTTARVHDTLSMAAMTDSSRYSLKLKDLAVSVYGRDDPRAIRYRGFEETFGKAGAKVSVSELLCNAPLDTLTEYATCDAWTTYQLHETLESQLRAITTWRGNTMWDLFETIEVPFFALLWEMEHDGIRVDAPRLTELSEAWTQEMRDIERQFAALAGRPINLNSPPQLRQYFLVDKGLKTDRVTKGGESGDSKAAVDKVTLEVWAAAGVAEVKLLSKYRELKTLVRKEIRNLLEKRDNNDRVHTTFNPHGAQTGRLSSRDPALQNIPVRTDLGKKIRECFIASPGMTLIVRDYSQLEMRLAAALSGDQVMLDLINSGKDIHAGNASIAFNLPYEAIMAAVEHKDNLKEGEKLSPEEKILVAARSAAKALGFGLLYGEGLRKLASQMKCSVEDARAKKSRFLGTFLQLSQYIDLSHQRLRERLHIQTLMGRMRALPAAALPEESAAYAEAMRQGFNAEIQGSARDVATLAMLRIRRDRRFRELGWRQLLQVHDEIISEGPAETAAEADKIMKEHMENCLADVNLKIPVQLLCSGKVCSNWAEGK